MEIPHNARYKPGAAAHNTAQAWQYSLAALTGSHPTQPGVATWHIALCLSSSTKRSPALPPFSSCKSGSCKPSPFPAHWFPLAHSGPSSSHANTQPCHALPCPQQCHITLHLTLSPSLLPLCISFLTLAIWSLHPDLIDSFDLHRR